MTEGAPVGELAEQNLLPPLWMKGLPLGEKQIFAADSVLGSRGVRIYRPQLNNGVRWYVSQAATVVELFPDTGMIRLAHAGIVGRTPVTYHVVAMLHVDKHLVFSLGTSTDDRGDLILANANEVKQVWDLGDPIADTQPITVDLRGAAETLGCTEDNVRALLKRGTLDGYKDIRGRWCIDRDLLEAYKPRQRSAYHSRGRRNHGE